ncbi:unnamed protein product [Microthlaspi erraticum]|uniref:RRM domain-containing protein n=1 Tax=Microthlaspi erraticum TaxID=1685480 RepID=A0A6D2HMQ8_9BRAS|nr:unnamed protein product [Microthlaspi erraticum]
MAPVMKPSRGREADGSDFQSSNLWVGSLTTDTTESDLADLFGRFGEIDRVTVYSSRSFAFVYYRRVEEAVAAKEALQGANLKGSQIKIEYARPAKPCKSLWVGGISPSVSKDELKAEFRKFGKIEDFRFLRDRKTAFIDFCDMDDAIQAKSMNGKRIGGSFLRVDFLRSQGPRKYPHSFGDGQPSKEGLQGSLFNDPGITIMYKHDIIPPERGYDTGLNSGVKRSRPETFINDPPYISSPHSSVVLDPTRPFRGSMERLHSGPEYSKVVGKEGSWRRPSPTGAGLLPSPAPSTRLPFMSNRGSWEGYDPAQLDREPKRIRRDGSVDDRAYGRASVAARPGRGFPDTDFIWRGVIAKGGTPVCHARCVPIGKGIETELPEMVNCSARTGLDMLAKHYTEAVGFEIVFFLPDSEDDFASYTEFLRYLGSNNRAGVAKLDDGTTLFLVPPSDFLTHVLKVSGPERLYGVVLKLPPPPVPAASSYRQESQPIPQSYLDQSRDSPANANNGLYDRALFDYNRSMQEEVKPPPKALFAPSSEPVSVSNTAMPQAGVSLTPELLATLASLLPETSRSIIASESHQSVGVSNVEAPSQAWNRDQPMVSEPLNRSFQQFGNQYNPPIHYPPVSSTPSYSSGMVHGGMQYQAPYVSMPQQAPLPSPLSNNYATYSQGSHQAVSQPMRPQYQPEAHMLNQNYIPVPGAENPALHVYQQGNYHGLANNQAHSGNYSHSQTAMQPLANKTNLDPSGHAQQQQLQTLLPGANQGTSDGEVDKNQRYQSTLQLAANLLQQIQQQQQLPSNASTGQRP